MTSYVKARTRAFKKIAKSLLVSKFPNFDSAVARLAYNLSETSKLKFNPEYKTYILLDPRFPGKWRVNVEDKRLSLPYRPFYVGKGKGCREKAHAKEALGLNDPTRGNRRKLRVIRQIHKAGLSPVELIASTGLIEPVAYAKEILLIKALGRKDLGTGPLTNLTEGGPSAHGRGPESLARSSEKSKETTARLKDIPLAWSDRNFRISLSLKDTYSKMTVDRKENKSRSLIQAHANMDDAKKAARNKKISQTAARQRAEETETQLALRLARKRRTERNKFAELTIEEQKSLSDRRSKVAQQLFVNRPAELEAQRVERIKASRHSRTPEQKAAASKALSDAVKRSWDARSVQERQAHGAKISATKKAKAAQRSEQEKLADKELRGEINRKMHAARSPERKAEITAKRLAAMQARPDIECPHCLKIGKDSKKMQRYHFKNCKLLDSRKGSGIV